jgi:hypothetical protein
MIRRGFWLTVGAVGGIMAYRRVAHVTQKGLARETIRFTRDVRDGMDLYIARHPGESGPTLGATTTDENEKDDR